MVLPVDIEHEVATLLGVIQCIKNIIPLFSQSGNQEEGMKGSFGETKKQKDTSLSKEQVLKVPSSNEKKWLKIVIIFLTICLRLLAIPLWSIETGQCYWRLLSVKSAAPNHHLHHP